MSRTPEPSHRPANADRSWRRTRPLPAGMLAADAFPASGLPTVRPVHSPSPLVAPGAGGRHQRNAPGHGTTTPAPRAQSRRRRRGYDVVGIDDLLGWDATTETVYTGPNARKTVLVLKMVVAAAFLGVLLATSTFPFLGAGAMTVNAATRYWNSLPSALPDQPLPQRSVILAADGSRIAQFYSENRVVVPLKDVPQVMQTALISIEDNRFYSHGAVDIRGTLRAFAKNATTNSVQGGSTLTQQYVKQVLANAATTTSEREAVTSRSSYLRKIREAHYAVALEKRLTKKQILEGYLNIAYFGDGAYGIGTAARHYFGEPVQKLTLPQAAMLAGMVQNPTGYDPTNHMAAARTRRDVVLYRMHQLGKISDGAYTAAKATPIRLHLTSPHNGCVSSRFPFFCSYVRQVLETDPAFGATPAAREQRLYEGGMVIKTTLNPKDQQTAQAAVDGELGRNNPIAANAVTVEPGTGHVIAMATNRTFGNPKPGRFDKTEMILPALHAYQPGSNMKPFTLAAALERGYNPKTVWYAPPVYAPAGMNYPGNGFTNSGSADQGPLNAAQALWRSSNTWYVHLEQEVGVLNVARMAQRLGITSLPMTGPNAITPRDASLTLGTYDVSPMEMAAAYATFAARGVHCDPTVITAVTEPDGTTGPVPDPNCHEAIPASVADTVASIMQGTIDGPDPYRTGATETIGRPAGGKTGTTENQASVWFSGFTPQYSTSVEVSDPRGGFAHPLIGFYAGGHYIARAYGGSVAGPIWRNVMAGIHQGLPKKAFTPPTGITGYTNVTPDVRGLTLPQAYQVLTAAGFKVTLNSVTAPADPLLATGRVYDTDPATGSLVGLGTTIQIRMTAGSNLHVNLAQPTPKRAKTTPAAPAQAGNTPGAYDTGGGIVSSGPIGH